MKLITRCKIGFKIFLNITPNVTNWTSDNKSFSLTFEENPLADFVELPDDGRAQDELWYSNILCGVIRGALEMVRTNYLSDNNTSLYENRLLCKWRHISSATYYEGMTLQKCE